MKFIASLVFLLLFFSATLSAKQLSFNKQTLAEQVQFTYQWLDQAQQLQSLSFTLDKASLFTRYRDFRSYKAPLARKYIDQRLRKKLLQEPIAGVKIKFLNTGNNLHLELSGENQAIVNQAYQTIARLEKNLMQEHLTRSFYTQYLSYDNSFAIKPDHVRFAHEAVSDFSVLKAIILNKFPSENVREVSNYVLGFVQSIPYNTLESRVSSTGVGFNPPLKTLWQNQGDCDSKVTMIAAIFRALMPRIKMMLIFIDNHALLALNIPSEGNELSINVNGDNYILVEPTGPAMLPIGQLSEAAEFAIRNGQYYAEAFFAPSA